MIDLAASNQARSPREEAQLFTLIALIFRAAMSIFVSLLPTPGGGPGIQAGPTPTLYFL